MHLISKNHRFTNHTAQELMLRVTKPSRLFLPRSLQKSAFNHHHDSSGKMFGFGLQSPWEALPHGEWKVSVVNVDGSPSETIYQIEVSSIAGKLYSGTLKISVTAVEQDSMISVSVDGKREVGLADYSDELVGAIIRSLIRESFTEIEQLMATDHDAHSAEEDDAEQDPMHIAPLAVAAGVFSAGMALGLLFWRRNRRNKSDSG